MPFLTALAPSARWSETQRKRHKTLTDWAAERTNATQSDPSGEHEPSAFLSTDLNVTPATMRGWFVSRWRVETTFQEVRAHLGVETQRQ